MSTKMLSIITAKAVFLVLSFKFQTDTIIYETINPL